jgi:hypothetical protein
MAVLLAQMQSRELLLMYLCSASWYCYMNIAVPRLEHS